jgi:hypothetical protein
VLHLPRGGRRRGPGIRHPRHLRTRPEQHATAAGRRYVRDESEQARELTELLSIFDAARADATFVMTFAAPLNPTSNDSLYDLDMASYSLVKSFGGRLGPLGAAHPEAPWDHNRLGTTYPSMPWEPKESFRAVADFYATHTPPAA